MTPTTRLTLSDYESLNIDTLDGLPWYASIAEAARDGWMLCSHWAGASPEAGPGREGLTVDEAIEIAGEDPDLIYLSRTHPYLIYLSRTRFSRGTR
jgi:hypothetical protein